MVAINQRSYWPILSSTLLKGRAYSCAIYDIVKSAPDGIEMAGIWISHRPVSDIDAYRKLDQAQRVHAIEFYRLKRSHVYRHIDSGVNATGYRWWSFVIASGPVRKAGLIICALVAAKDEEEVRAAVLDLQAIFRRKRRIIDFLLRRAPS